MGGSFYFFLGAVLWIVLALWPAYAAKRKGYSFILFFLLAILISWLLALIIALVMPNKRLTAADRRADDAAEQALEKEEG